MSRAKEYYQCLLMLDSSLTLTSRIPSDELVIFFRLLLRGCKVEPGASQKEYQLLDAQAQSKDLNAMEILGDVVREALEDCAEL